jgi:glucokinase
MAGGAELHQDRDRDTAGSDGTRVAGTLAPGAGGDGDSVAIALDIGGTKTAAALVTAQGDVLRSARMATRGGHADVLGEMERLITEVAGADGLERAIGLGISSAGPVNLTAGTVAPVNIPELRDIPLLKRLAGLVPGRPARLVGDGLAAAAGENWAGAGRGCDNMLAIVVSTGVGGGLILDGRLHGGASGNAGHVGHAPVSMDGTPCPCGGQGCPEAYASGPSMVAFALRNGWRPGTRVDGEGLAEAAGLGDPVALLAFERGARALATMIAAVAATCDVTRVIVGGGVAEAGPVLMDPLRRALGPQLALSFLAGLEIVPAELGTRACLVGAGAIIHRPDRYAPGDATAQLIRS